VLATDKIMGLKEIVEDFENTAEPRLEEIREWFKGKPYKVDVSTIQRYFSMGYRQASRALRQLNE